MVVLGDIVILSEAKDRPTHASDARASHAPPTRSFASLRMTAEALAPFMEHPC
jgi:hypothetical protein